VYAWVQPVNATSYQIKVVARSSVCSFVESDKAKMSGLVGQVFTALIAGKPGDTVGPTGPKIMGPDFRPSYQKGVIPKNNRGVRTKTL